MAGTRIASFHLVRERRGRAVLSLVRLAADRPGLARTERLQFWRLLGTGRGSDTSIGADLRRRALLAVWEEESALDCFLATSPIARRWHGSEETYTVRLRALGGHGRWRGRDVLAGMVQGQAEGPVAVVTRAVVRVRAWPAFVAAGRPVSAEVAGAPGLLAVAGIGEAPFGRQATFSLWRNGADASAFAYGSPEHSAVVRRTREEGWYGEELFARFEPFASEGTWDGRDPLRP